MELEKRIRVLEDKMKELEERANAHYADIGNILRFLKKKYPNDFYPGGQIKPLAIQ